MEDGRCKLGLAGRLELVRLIESGATFRQAAAGLGVAPATAHRWWQRWQAASEPERASRACLRARPPIPRSCPWRLSVETERRILDARERTNLGPARLAGVVGHRRSTIWKVLHRHGCSRQRRTPKERFTRGYEWSEPGALLHMDAKQLPVFTEPGHWGARRPHPPATPPHRVPRRHCVRARRDRRPQPPGLRRDPPPRPRRDRGWRPASSRSVDDRARLRHHPSGHDRQRDDLPPQPQLHGRDHRARRPPHPHPGLHPKVERQSRTIHPHHARRLGLRPGLPRQRRTQRGARRLARLLQSPPTTRRPQPQATHRTPNRAEQTSSGPTPDMESRLERRDKPAWR